MLRCCASHVMLQAGVEVSGIMGTSAGALTGSLYAAGYTPKEVCHDSPQHCRQTDEVT
jgi:predicted acylesterase/phospholipase RssA